MLSDQALGRFIALRPKRVLDIGSGTGEHAAAMREAGLNVTTIDLGNDADLRGDYLLIDAGKFDGIWCSHVLEHCLNVNAFLVKMRHDLEPDGILAITVPPLRYRLVGGHINLFTEGTLVYNLVLAGFDCSKASVGVYGYNLSVVVRNNAAQLPTLFYDKGDIELLYQYFPWYVEQGIGSKLGSVRW